MRTDVGDTAGRSAGGASASLGGLLAAIERLEMHDHLCLIYENREEQFAAVIPFMRLGLERGEKCVYIADDNLAAEVLEEMRREGIDTEAALASGALTVTGKQATYLQGGFFSPEKMIAFLEEAIDQAKEEGFRGLRATGEMTWMLGGGPGVERLIEYEAKLNYFLPTHDIVAICQYNRRRFSPEILAGVIDTHSLVICGGLVCPNQFYVPPDDFLDAQGPARDVDRRLAQLVALEENRLALLESDRQLQLSQRLEAVGRLAGGIAHDFNNLLTVIMGYSDMVLADRSSHDPDAPELVEIRRAAQRGASLVRQLLAFSRQQTLRPRVLNVNDIVGFMEGLLRPTLGEDIELSCRLSPSVRPVEADPGQLEQVLLNLAVNARDAMSGGGLLAIETSNVTLDEDYASAHVGVLPGSYVMIAVADTGTGMEEEALTHIFEPFFTTKGEGGGTGLGLSTVYGIVKQSGGNVWVYSEVGRGTTFKVYLPSTNRAVDWRPTETAAPAETHFAEASILVVEDEPTVSELTTRILAPHARVVRSAADPAAALALARQGPAFDLLITDVLLPGMNGRTLADILLSECPGLKVMFMSGYSRNVIAHEGHLEPGVAFLEKPFSAAQLVAAVGECLGRSEQPSGPGEGPG